MPLIGSPVGAGVTLVLKPYNLTIIYIVTTVTKAGIRGFIFLPENFAYIYTVSKHLAHREIRSTEIYAKIIDKKMKEVANLLPKLNLELL
ncbi:hypothetical protein [Arenibacter certesii]|uniref:Uncharacterized protein n=1 Tax=Arenibacter certesii TaxID=228955 RepID=A0A918IYN9_9FLAO|nr:hypothetical protein GCM10007383_24760 [Arenibacter certesii]